MRRKTGFPLFALFSVIGILFILLSGSAALLWQIQHQQQSLAVSQDEGAVTGPPSLPAATVDSIFARLGSPMAGTGSVVEQASRATNIDDAFALAVWWTETNDGEAGVGLADRNPGSVRGSYGYPSAYDGYTIYPSYADAIIDWFNVLKSRYISRGLTSVYSICYPYVGTASSLQWAYKVVNLMIRYRGEAPPPPTPTIMPTVNPVVRAHKEINQQVSTTPPPVQARQGLQQESAKPTRTLHSTSVQSAPLTQAERPLSRNSEIVLMTLGLLTALLIALIGLWLKRDGVRMARIAEMIEIAQRTPPLATPITQTLAPSLESAFGFVADPSTSLLKPLLVNQYSPLSETTPLSLHETEQLPFPVSPGLLNEIGFENSAASYQRNTEALPRRITLRPLPPTPQRYADDITGDTEQARSVPLSAIPVPMPLPTAHSASRGLLARYGARERAG